MSIEPSEMAAFVRSLRDVETAMGTSRRIMAPTELQKRDAIRRSIFLKGPAKAGQKLSEVEIEFRRPGYGIGPDYYDSLLDATFTKDMDAGARLSFSDLEQDSEAAKAA